MRTCKICKASFTPMRSIQPTCGAYDCMVAYAESRVKKVAAKRAAADRAVTREKLEAIKTKPMLIAEAQAAYNAFIRLRDRDMPCISCGTHGGAAALTGGYWDCGHYRSTGAAPQLRFNEWNAAKQCKRCNRDRGGNVVEYRKGLIGRIGVAMVEALECDNVERKYTHDELREIRNSYKEEVKKLLREATNK